MSSPPAKESISSPVASTAATRQELPYRLRQQSLLGEFGRSALQTRDIGHHKIFSSATATALGQLGKNVFNFLNLLSPSFGLMRLPNQSILRHVGQVRGAPSQPAFRFDPKKLSSIGNLESGYQLQLSIRYSF